MEMDFFLSKTTHVDSENLKVALLTDGISPIVTGGMQKHSFYLAKFLAMHRVHVDLYHCVSSKDKYNLADLYSAEELVYIHEVPVPFPKKGILPFHYIRNSFKYSVDLLHKFKSRERVDFIYAQGFTAWAFFRDRRKGNIDVPIGVNFHGLEMFQLAEGWKSKLTQYLFKGPVKYNLQHADFSYSLGGKLTDILRQFCQEDKIKEISIGLEKEWLVEAAPRARQEAGKTKLVFVGRYERRKGIEELNLVMDQLNDDRVSFDFIGPIPKEKQRDMSNITYHGLIREEDKLKAILDKADILICPSLAEGMPTVILEAMSRGLAVIATDVGAVACITDSELLKKKTASIQKIKDEFLWSQVIVKTIDHMKEGIQK